MRHTAGHAVGSAWESPSNLAAESRLSLGPDGGVKMPAGCAVARFVLSIGSKEIGTSDDGNLFWLNIYDMTQKATPTEIADRMVKSGEFSAANSPVAFDVPFKVLDGSKIQFSISVWDYLRAPVRHLETEFIASVDPALCKDSYDPTMPSGTSYKTSKGAVFERVQYKKFGKAWSTPDGLVWSEYQGIKLNYPRKEGGSFADSEASETCARLGGRVPTNKEWLQLMSHFEFDGKSMITSRGRNDFVRLMGGSIVKDASFLTSSPLPSGSDSRLASYSFDFRNKSIGPIFYSHGAVVCVGELEKTVTKESRQLKNPAPDL